MSGEQATPAPDIEPAAFLVRADNGNIRLWSSNRAEAERCAEVNGGGRLEPLYSADLVSAILADRKRLEAEVERLREALRETLDVAELFIPVALDAPGFRRARAALSIPSQKEAGHGR